MTELQSPDAIHVALCFDDNFWAPAYALMRSACLATSRRGDLVFHLLHDDLAAERNTDLSRITEEFGATLVHYPLQDNAEFNALCRTLPIDKRLHIVIYARLLLDRLLPRDVKRVIYLDCDVMVRAPLEVLYGIDVEEFPIAAVSDPLRLRNMMGRDMRTKVGIFEPSSPYFNSGVLLIDLERYAAIDIPARVEDLRRRGLIERLYFDQDMLNLIFSGNWKQLNWRYNLIDPRPAHEGLDPYIIHYTGYRKPWNLISGVAFANSYRHVMTNELYYRYMRHRWKRYWGKRLRRLIGR